MLIYAREKKINEQQDIQIQHDIGLDFKISSGRNFQETNFIL